ncbi:hypothetical protein FHG64_09820 [Antarcticibacterium flavum]|uniref:Uncharacterized protein n=1 Tax=Antarcticibacterium flavum TaxID=2058175 RepID=A0A5B7X301_9FLAO|nr:MULTISPECIES: hypothetical protein [Antarcticibacterium]MCM4160116.1 hypothetical protein [Antarcticibacterium sp. W02-3]QCY69670.1 hypothetical protein FHG64_09820 [Antarcticibacterium flavum]
MKIFVRHIIVILVLLFSMSYTSYGQSPCEPGFVQCRGRTECIPARNCGVGPPPPGLVVPIDTNIGLLLAAGFGLGIYFLVSSGKKKEADS